MGVKLKNEAGGVIEAHPTTVEYLKAQGWKEVAADEPSEPEEAEEVNEDADS